MKKLLVLTNVYPSNDLSDGDTPVVHYFTKEWIKFGYEVHVIHYPANFPKIYMMIASLFSNYISSKLGAKIRTYKAQEKGYKLDGVKIKRIPLTKYKIHGRYSKKEMDKAYSKTEFYLEHENYTPDVIISHWVNPQLEIMDRLKTKFNCKTCYIAHLATIEFERIYTDIFSQSLIDNIDLIGFRSAYIRDSFSKKFHFTNPSFQCYSGIPDKYIPLSPIERAFDNIQNFIFVGSLIKRKHPTAIIPALVYSYGQDIFNLTYIGQGAEIKSIKKCSNRFGIENSVHILGRVERDKVIQKLQSNDVFVMISQGETFGLVYLEAMAQGLITIASRNEGFDGIIEHGKNGFLCTAGNVEELALLIKEIRQMPSNQLQKISMNAIETAKKLTDKNAAFTYIEAIEKYC